MPIKISQLPELTSFTDDANTLMVLVDLTEPTSYLRTKKITVENYLKSALEFGSTPGVFYVSPQTGDDTNDGSSWERAFLTVEKALQEVGNSNADVNLIELAPGIYETEGHLDMPDNTVIKAVHRTAIFRPKPPIVSSPLSATSSTITFEGNFSTSNNAYQAARIRIISGPGSGESVKTIKSYDGTTKTATLKDGQTFSTLPTSDSVFSLEFEERNVFRMGSGCFLEGALFEDWRLDDMEDPTEGFAVSFRPGAVIRRVPYAHKIAVRTTPYWGVVPPPLDRDANPPNPLVGRGMGVALADGDVCSPYSIFPNIMTWGATPVSHNGIGYCAKNGGLINAINAVSIWQHRHFYALKGGQIILSACSTQFGDYTMVAKGGRKVVVPNEITIPLTVEAASNTEIQNNRIEIIDNMVDALNTGGYFVGWDAEDIFFTRQDANTFIQSLGWTLSTGNEKPMIDFAKGFFDTDVNASPVFSNDKLDAFKYSFTNMRDQIVALPGVSSNAINIVTDLVIALNNTLTTPNTRIEPSTITAVGHTWSSILTGVALTKIPPARNLAKIQDSILELADENGNPGVVIASGQDDQGSALFVGGMTIDADTGELGGSPFTSAVSRIANKTVISRSF